MANLPRHGKNAYFALIFSGTTTKFSTAANDVKFPRTVDMAEISTFALGDKQFVPGHRDATLAVSGNWTSTKDKMINSCLGSTGVTFVYGPESTATGRRKFTGSVLVTSWNTASPAKDMVSFDLALQCSGAITASTF